MSCLDQSIALPLQLWVCNSTVCGQRWSLRYTECCGRGACKEGIYSMIFCRLDHARVHAECSFTPTEAGDSSACGQREVLGYTEQCGSMQGLSDLMYFLYRRALQALPYSTPTHHTSRSRHGIYIQPSCAVDIAPQGPRLRSLIRETTEKPD